MELLKEYKVSTTDVQVYQGEIPVAVENDSMITYYHEKHDMTYVYHIGYISSFIQVHCFTDKVMANYLSRNFWKYFMMSVDLNDGQKNEVIDSIFLGRIACYAICKKYGIMLKY